MSAALMDIKDLLDDGFSRYVGAVDDENGNLACALSRIESALENIAERLDALEYPLPDHEWARQTNDAWALWEIHGPDAAELLGTAYPKDGGWLAVTRGFDVCDRLLPSRTACAVWIYRAMKGDADGALD